MKRDIESREDIEFLIDAFYTKVKKDDVIGYIFTDVVNLSWDKHLPIMYDFWESVLLNANKYRGNPMHTHLELNKKEPLTKEHFTRWKKLFFETLDEHFEGEKVALAKHRVEAMEAIMLLKMGRSF